MLHFVVESAESGDKKNQSNEKSGVLPSEVLAHIAEDFKCSIEKPSGHNAGFNEDLYSFFLGLIKTHLSLEMRPESTE